jgi:hypothetical protein
MSSGIGCGTPGNAALRAHDRRGDAADGKVVERIRGRNAERFAQFRLQADKRKRIAAELEKIAAPADRFDVEELLQDRGNAALDIVSWRLRPKKLRGGGQGERGERPTIDLVARGHRQRVEKQVVARQHVRRKALRKVAPDWQGIAIRVARDGDVSDEALRLRARTARDLQYRRFGHALDTMQVLPRFP